MVLKAGTGGSPAASTSGMTGRRSRDGVAGPAVQLERGRIRRRPDHRPGRRRHRHPDPVARREPISRVPQRDPDLLDPAGLQRLRVRVGASMGEVEDAGADPRRGPVRGHVGQPDDGGRDRRIDREVEHDHRLAEDRRPARSTARSCRSARGSRPAGGRARARSARCRRPTTGRPASRASADAGIGRCRAPRRHRGAGSPRRHRHESADQRQRSAREPPRHVPRRRMRERRRGPPPPRPRRRERLRLGVVALEPDDRRLVIEAVRVALAAIDRRSGRPRAARRGSGRAWRSTASRGPSCRRASGAAPSTAPASGTPHRHTRRSSRRRSGSAASMAS